VETGVCPVFGYGKCGTKTGVPPQREVLRCADCGREWVNEIALDLVREGGRCLACGSTDVRPTGQQVSQRFRRAPTDHPTRR